MYNFGNNINKNSVLDVLFFTYDHGRLGSIHLNAKNQIIMVTARLKIDRPVIFVFKVTNLAYLPICDIYKNVPKVKQPWSD